MIHNLSDTPSVALHFLAELRNISVQSDQMRFRRNLERLGEIFAYEISKILPYEPYKVETPLGEATTKQIVQQPVLGTILRAGLPLHNGLLNYFDKADNAFISAYRRHHKDGSFEIKLEYISCPDLTDRVLILADPMLASGASIVTAVKELMRFGKPSSVHVVAAIAAQEGIDYIRRKLPYIHIWTAAIDEELTAKSYIVPGLGDAGDLAYGLKVQD